MYYLFISSFTFQQVPWRLLDFFTPDSSSISEEDFKIGIYAHLSEMRNWQQQSSQNFQWKSDFNLTRKRQDSFQTIRKEFSGNLGFSLTGKEWSKVFDEIEYFHQINHNLDHAFTFANDLKFRSQFLPDYTSELQGGDSMRIKLSGMLSPGIVEMTTGLCWNFWKNSYFRIGFGSLKLILVVDEEVLETEQFKTQYGMDHNLGFQMGYDMKLDIQEQITKRMIWQNKSSFFAGSTGKEMILKATVLNRIQIELVEWLKIKFENHLKYEPRLTDEVQTLQVFYLGVIISN